MLHLCEAGPGREQAAAGDDLDEAPRGGTLIVAPLSVLDAVWARELASKVVMIKYIMTIIIIVVITVMKPLPAHDELGTCRTSLVSPKQPCASLPGNYGNQSIIASINRSINHSANQWIHQLTTQSIIPAVSYQHCLALCINQYQKESLPLHLPLLLPLPQASL